jgi:hypothetical protein
MRFGSTLISLRQNIKHLKLTNNSVEKRCVFFTNRSNSLPYIDYSVGTYQYKLEGKIGVRFHQLLEIVAFKRLGMNLFSVQNIRNLHLQSIHLMLPAPHVESMF